MMLPAIGATVFTMSPITFPMFLSFPFVLVYLSDFFGWRLYDQPHGPVIARGGAKLLRNLGRQQRALRLKAKVQADGLRNGSPPQVGGVGGSLLRPG